MTLLGLVLHIMTMGGEGRNAQISYELQAGQIYYIKIRGFGATEERGYIYF